MIYCKTEGFNLEIGITDFRGMVFITEGEGGGREGGGVVKMFDIFKHNFYKVTCSNGEVFLTFVKLVFHVIYQTRGRVFPPISKHREVGWKNEAQPSFF